MRSPARWRSPFRLFVGLAVGKILLAGLCLVMALAAGATGTSLVGGETRLPTSVHTAVVLVFSLGAALLLIGGRRDSRALALGGVFLALASVYADRLLALSDGASAQLAGLLYLEAFLPYFLWRFLRLFPRTHTTPRADRGLELGSRLSLAFGAAANLLSVPQLATVVTGTFEVPDLVYELQGPLYLWILMLLLVAALPFAAWRMRAAEAREERRVRLFLSALVAGLAPLVAVVVLELALPSFDIWLEAGGHRRQLAWLVFPPLLSVPLTTAYAVLVHRVLEIRTLARRAIRYALARATVLALAAAAPAVLVFWLYLQRSLPLEQIVRGPRALGLLAMAALAVLALRYRRLLLDAIDRRFFREQFDARRILTPLVAQIRSARDPRELADLVEHGVDRALHLNRVGLLLEDTPGGPFRSSAGHLEPLEPSSALLRLLADGAEPLDLGLDDLELRLPAPRLSETLAALPEPDRRWILDAGIHLLVPVVQADGTLGGVLALGEKRSALPFLSEDRQLLATIAHAVALALEVQHLRQASGDRTGGDGAPLPSQDPAEQCSSCGKLFLAHTETCPFCAVPLKKSSVPFVLPGKFRFEQRLGAGGMGVVYRAVDLALSRPVAVKTLRRISVEDALRLRREARAAAAVHHPNLATIYGVESWHGTPMLILQYLEGGTLRERLREAPNHRLGIRETLSLGLALASALEKLHCAQILHRDLKPSNIGFSREGLPKLMDFGIARFRYDPRREAPSPSAGGSSDSWEGEAPTLDWNQKLTPPTISRALVGTVQYLSPEALNERPPDATFDLWSLNVVLWECLAGRRLFDGNLREILEKIRNHDIPDLAQLRPDCPRPLVDLFHRTLHQDHSQRPKSAGDLQQALRQAQSHTPATSLESVKN